MRFGFKSDEWQLIEKLALTPLRAEGCHVWVFGSRARGSHRPFSDIDILVEVPANGLPPGKLASIRTALEESRLPVKVDLVRLDELAEAYRDGVLRDRVEV